MSNIVIYHVTMHSLFQLLCLISVSYLITLSRTFRTMKLNNDSLCRYSRFFPDFNRNVSISCWCASALWVIFLKVMWRKYFSIPERCLNMEQVGNVNKLVTALFFNVAWDYGLLSFYNYIDDILLTLFFYLVLLFYVSLFMNQLNGKA